MNSSVESFTTPRLNAQRLQPDDFKLLATLFQDPRVMATLGGRLFTDHEIQTGLERGLEHWTQHGYGIWLIHDRETSQFIGRIGLRHVTIADVDEVELLYTLRPEAWNQGLATEASRKVVELAFQSLSLSELVAFTLPTNLGSRRVMEKCGFRFERNFIHADLPHVLYRWNTNR